MGEGLGVFPIGTITYHDESCFFMLEDFVEDAYHIASSFDLSEITYVGQDHLVCIGKHGTLAGLGVLLFLFYIDEVGNYIDMFLYIKEFIGHIPQALRDSSYSIGGIDTEIDRCFVIRVITYKSYICTM